MTTNRVDIIDRSVEKTHIWLNELGTEDRKYAYRVLRAVLHAVRDRLTVNETAQLAAQLPELIRGICYEGWDPSGVPATTTTTSRSLTASRRRRPLPASQKPRMPPRR